MQLSRLSFLLYLPLIFFITGCSGSSETGKNYFPRESFTSYDTVKAGRFDTGKMWTFEHAPIDYFSETYSFNPDREWLDDVRLSALKFGGWCTASFVSEDGLIMTNHHCVDFILSRFEDEGEDLAKNGFYAQTLSEERKVPGLTVKQTAFIKDVTYEVQKAFNSGKTKEEKLSNKEKTIAELIDKYSEKTGFECEVTSLYNGGKFSLYGYNVYDDIRAVYTNETDMGLWGGDPDNFTYPRYNPDFAFLRVYDENGNPLNSENYYQFSTTGPQPGEPLFVIGNPGKTYRLKTLAQLEYYRDYTYKYVSYLRTARVDFYRELLAEYPERADEFNKMIVALGNGEKVYREMYKTLCDPYFIARKADFENKFRSEVEADKELLAKYGHLWNSIKNTRAELSEIAPQRSAFIVSPYWGPAYLHLAQDLVDFAYYTQSPNEQRIDKYKEENLEETIEALFPEDYDKPVENRRLRLQCDYIDMILGSGHPVAAEFTNGKTGDAAVRDLLSRSLITNKEDVVKLAKAGPQAILTSSDPFIKFILSTQEKLAELEKQAAEITETESVLEDQLGQALFAVYGTSIPPDATFTIRISDGKLKGYDYNGTIAPLFTTFYGMYDRYYSHGNKYPWDLPERWLDPAVDLDLSTFYNFISTNDITGGASGSAVINKNAELVGIAFDGNMESIPGNLIFMEELNRCVSVTSQAIIEILDKVAQAERISAELKAGRIPDDYKQRTEVTEIEGQANTD